MAAVRSWLKGVLSTLHRNWVAFADNHRSAFRYCKATRSIIFQIDTNVAPGRYHHVLIDDGATNDRPAPDICSIHQYATFNQSSRMHNHGCLLYTSPSPRH